MFGTWAMGGRKPEYGFVLNRLDCGWPMTNGRWRWPIRIPRPPSADSTILSVEGHRTITVAKSLRSSRAELVNETRRAEELVKVSWRAFAVEKNEPTQSCPRATSVVSGPIFGAVSSGQAFECTPERTRFEPNIDCETHQTKPFLWNWSN